LNKKQKFLLVLHCQSDSSMTSSLEQREEALRHLVATEHTKRQELESAIEQLETTIAVLTATLATERDRRAALLREATELASRVALLSAASSTSAAPTPSSSSASPTASSSSGSTGSSMAVALLQPETRRLLRYESTFSRDDAEIFLSGKPLNSFVTRPSRRAGTDAIALSFVAGERATVHHTLIRSTPDNRFYTEHQPDAAFATVPELLNAFDLDQR
jgi:hypothetical protein